MEGENINLDQTITGMTDDEFALAFDAIDNGGSFDVADKTVDTQTTDSDQTIATADQDPADNQAAVDQATADQAAVDKAAAEKEAADQAAADKAAAEQAAAEQAAIARAAADKAAADQAAVIKAAADREQFTAEEQAAIAEATTNFPEVVGAIKAVERVLQARYENMLTAKLAEVASQYEQRLAPIAQSVQSTVHDKHVAAIVGAHADAFEILPAVETWINTQPQILRGAYNQVLDRGTAGEVVELLNVYKESTGAAAKPAVAAGPTPEEVERQRKLAAQEGVRGRHTAGERTSAVDPNDFEGAFEKFAAN